MTAETSQNNMTKHPPAEQKPRGFTLRHKIITGFGGLMLLMALCIAFTLYKLSTIEKSAISVIEHRQPTTVTFLSFSEDANLAISLLNEYLLTGQEADIARYQLVENRLGGYLVNIESLAEKADEHIPAGKIKRLKELLAEIKMHGNHLIFLRGNNADNYPGIRLATVTLNQPALEFMGTVNEILANDDIDASGEKAKTVRNYLFELRYTWSQMMNSLRLYFNSGVIREIENFDNYSEVNGEILAKLKSLNVEVGFDAVDTLIAIRNKYLQGVPTVVEFRRSDGWRADIDMMRTKVRPLIVEMRSILKKLVSKQVREANKSGDALTASLEQIRLYTISLLVFALSIGLLLSAMITRGIIPPLRELMEAARLVASGDLNAEVNVKSRDEIGMLGGSFNTMINGLRAAELEKQDYLDDLEKLNSKLEDRVTKRTEDLERSEARIRTIYDNVGEGIVVIDEKGYIDSINPAAQRIFGLGNKDVIGMHAIFLLADKNYSDLKKSDAYIDDKDGPFKTNSTKHPVELQGKRMDGSSFPMEMVVTGMKLGDENMRACIVRDITLRREAEARLEEAQSSIVNAAHKSGMAEMATGVLHNIGNILNSVNVSVEVISRIARNSKVTGLSKANAMLSENIENLGEFLSNDQKGKKLPEYYLKLGKILEDELGEIIDESNSLSEKTTMMKEVIGTQQSYATAGAFTEEFQVAPLIDDALKVQEASLHKWGVKVVKNYIETPDISAQKSKLLQVITNLIKNAREATIDNDEHYREKEIKIEIGLYKNKSIYVSIHDNGCGIDKDNLSNIFNHGFTTKEAGHGFGLHTSANSMTEMGGNLTASSDGHQRGSCFTVSIPIADSSSTTYSDDNNSENIVAISENN